MTWTWLELFYLALVLDSLVALWLAWFRKRWFSKLAPLPATYFPPAKGWATLYFVLTALLLLTARGVIA